MPLPNFLIVGAAKSGTTSLYRYLEQHPDVFMSPVKEPQFFAPDLDLDSLGERHGVATMAEYLDLFSGADGCRAIGEASPQYLFSSEAAVRIDETLPDVKLIVVLRDPVDRAYSAYLHLRRDGVEPLSDFREALRAEPRRMRLGWAPIWCYASMSLYFEQLRRYLDRFGPERFRVYLYEEFAADPGAVTQDIFGFLGVDSSFEPDTTLRFNPGGLPRNPRLHRLVGHDTVVRRGLLRFLPERMKLPVVVNLISRNLEKPKIDPEARRELLEVFAADIERTAALINRDLSAWLS